jgi:hypothetical protein
MRARLLAGLLMILIMGGLSACDIFGPPRPPSGEATITIGEAEILPGETTTVEVSAKVSAGPGLAEIQVGPNGALIFNPAIVQVKEIRGVGGFTVLASSIDNSSGEAKFAAAVFQGAVRDGTILAIEVEAVGSPGESSYLRLTGVDVLRDASGNTISIEAMVEGHVRIRG